MSDAAIHRVSKDAYGLCGSPTETQWIATPFRLAMTGMVDQRNDQRFNPMPLLTFHPPPFHPSAQ